MLYVGIRKVSLTLFRIRDNINVPHSSNLGIHCLLMVSAVSVLGTRYCRRWMFASIGSSDLHFFHDSLMYSGICSSQSTFCSQVSSIRIFIQIIAGANQPRASNIRDLSDLSDSIILLVKFSACLGADMVMVNKSVLVFHDTPKVFDRPVPETVIESTSSDSLNSEWMDSSTCGLLEFHLHI